MSSRRNRKMSALMLLEIQFLLLDDRQLETFKTTVFKNIKGTTAIVCLIKLVRAATAQQDSHGFHLWVLCVVCMFLLCLCGFFLCTPGSLHTVKTCSQVGKSKTLSVNSCVIITTRSLQFPVIFHSLTFQPGHTSPGLATPLPPLIVSHSIKAPGSHSAAPCALKFWHYGF